MRTFTRTLTCIAWVAMSAISCGTMPTAPGERVTVTGLIQDRDGNPVSNAYISFQARSRLIPYGGSAVTDASGHYRIDVSEARYDVYVHALGFADAVVRDREISKDRRRLDYRFTGYWVTGALTGPNGTTLPGAEVYASGTTLAQPRVESGHYSVLLPAGSYDFHFRPGYGVLGLPEILVELSVSRDTTLDVAIDGNVVTGTVTGPGGGPLAGAEIYASSEHATVTQGTDLNGHYEIRVPTGSYLIRVMPPDALSFIASRQAVIPVSSPMTLDFDLSGTRWSGFVRLASDSTPVAGARVFATEGGYAASASASSDATGRFQFVVRTGGVYQIQTYVGNGSYHATPFSVEAGADSTFDIYLEPGSEIVSAGPLSMTAPPPSSRWRRP